MRINPDYEGHRRALNLAARSDHLSVSVCRDCGHGIAWATSKRTGKKYPCNVYPKQDMEQGSNSDVLRAAPWDVHTKDICNRNREDQA